jgi:tetratricopeptide (TPR) repeat protein
MQKLPDGSWDARPVPKTKAELLARQGDDALRKHQEQKAEALLKDAIDTADRNGEAKAVREPLNQLANLYFREQKYDKAEPLMLRMVKMRDKDLASNFKVFIGIPKKGGGYSRHIYPIFPNYPTTLADIYEKTGRSQEAEKYLTHIMETERGLCPPWDYGTDLVNLGDFYMRHKQLSKASPLFEERLGLVLTWSDYNGPSQFENLHKYALCMRQQNKSEDAIAPLSSALKIMHDDYKNLKAVMDGFNPIDKISRPDPKMYLKALTTLYTDLGDCLQDTGDFKGAATAYKKALEIDPSFGPAKNANDQLQKHHTN